MTQKSPATEAAGPFFSHAPSDQNMNHANA